MEGNWILKVCSQKDYKKQNFINKNFINKKTRKNGNYYINTYIDKPKKQIKKLNRAGIKCSCYRVEYERASNYRNVFFSRTHGPYRCRYCNKKLDKSAVFVDHIIPVSKCQKTSAARMLLSINNCSNVNDIKNLAPACKRCNLKKSDKMGLWIIRGFLGRYKWYWALLYVLSFIFIAFSIIGIIATIYAFF